MQGTPRRPGTAMTDCIASTGIGRRSEKAAIASAGTGSYACRRRRRHPTFRVNLPPGDAKPKATTGVATRVVRSTAVAQAVKALYDDYCQVCDMRLEVPGGAVSEGAHIKALGNPHHGPDVPENVLCLCPNHHTLLDEGGLYITDDMKVHDHQGQVLGPLYKHAKHVIGLEYVKYHRALWGR